jgi:hypothetical protein
VNWLAAKAKVLTRGTPPDSFLDELLRWGRFAPEEIFAPNENPADIYAAVKPELGPWQGPLHRRAVMLEVLRVLAGFESSWNWNEGIDSTRHAADTDENSEAGAWQVSADSRRFGEDLHALLRTSAGSLVGVAFQQAMKSDHALAMEYAARLLRHTTRHNGPLYRDRHVMRESMRGAEQSIYPWLSRAAVAEFEARLG